MKKKEFLNKYVAYEKVEDIPDKILAKLIEESMDVEIYPIKAIPYKGEIEQTAIYEYPELTAACPMTRIQDLYTLKIKITPNKWIPELKSLKFYLMGYNEFPISHEHLQAKIFKDLKKALNPKKLEVILDVAVRGGIKTTISIVNNLQR